MFNSLVPNLLTSAARALLASLATYLISVGVLPTNGENDFVAAGVSAVLIAWSWWEKVGHDRLVATMAKVPPTVKAQAAVAAGVPPAAVAIVLLTLALGFAPQAHAGDMPTKAQNYNPFAGYIAGRCGFYFDLNSMGGAGALSGTTVPGASVIQGDIGAGLGYGCPLGNAPGSFWFAQADFDFANINGAANGLSMTGPAHFEQRLAIGGPIANVLSFFPGNPLSSLSTPSTPACPTNVTCGPQYAFLFASLHEQDVGMQLPAPVPSNRAWLAYPGLGLGLESRWSNGLVVDATIQWTMQSTALGIGTENVKFGNGALAGLVFKY